MARAFRRSLALLSLTVLTLASAGCSHGNDDPSAFRGVRLGLTAPDTRQRFHPAAAGSWAASVATTGEEAITWKANEPSTSDVQDASFEFHNGMLVAIRAHERPTADEARAPGRQVTAVTVRRVEPASASEPEARLTILARDCPTHAAEVAEILK